MSDDSDNNADKVGYGKPPKHTQFKPGQSGNPKGRKRRSRNTSSILRDELEIIIDVREGGRVRKLSKRQALIKTLVNDAIAGKNQARQLLLQIIEVGSPPEAFEATQNDQEILEAFLASQKGPGDEPGE